MSPLRMLSAVAATSLLAAAGCGGGGSGATTPGASEAGEITTYRDTNLPGKMLVNHPAGDAVVFDLRTGERTPLPTLEKADARWTAGASADTVLRWELHPSAGAIPIAFFSTRTWTRTRDDITIHASFDRPKLSADGKRILTFWHDSSQGVFSSEKNPLTIFDAEQGAVVKRGSMLPEDDTVISSPVAWLPDGQYVYLLANALYISSPSEKTSRLIATLDLPINGDFGDYVSGTSTLVASPDGTHLAFTWRESRGTAWDGHIWVVRADGTGLRRITKVPDEATAMSYGFVSPTWSPDGRWIAGMYNMSGSVVAPIFPDDQSFPLPGGVIGSTGCGTNQVFVLPADAERTVISWPRFDAQYGIKVRGTAGQPGGQWLSACGDIAWLP